MSSDLQARLQAALGDAYRIERELARGGMSQLFLATEASLNRQVVVKLLPPELTSEVSAARFRQEIELAAHLQHPNILPVLNAGSRDGLLYYILPYVAGESLRHRLIREGKLPVADAVRILHEVADALAYAHAEGVIHRDIKPENLLLEGSHAVLTDFGVARALAEARSGGRLTETGVALGTPGYMPPEQAVGERTVDARADIYALAVVGYEMLAGAPPFAAANSQALVAAHLTSVPRPLSELRPEVPAEVCAALKRALARDPAVRLQTAAEFRDAMTPRSALSPGRRRIRPWLAAAGALILALAVAFAVSRRPRPAAALDPNLVAVVPFDVLAPDLELWREGLVDLLSRSLDGAGPLRTVSPTVVVRQWRGRADPASASELGRRTGAGLAVFGSVVGAGADSVRLTAVVLDVASRRALGEIERRDAKTHLDRLADSATISLLRELGRSRPIGTVRLAGVGSSSVSAVKAFLQGEQFLRRAAWDSAAASYERAIALDSGFALAFHHLSLVLGWQRSIFDSVSRVYSLRAGALNRGLAPRDSLLLTADSLTATLFGPADTASWSRARRLHSTVNAAVRRYPEDPQVWYTIAEARFHSGYGPGLNANSRQILAAFDRAIALDSAFAPAYIHAVELAGNIGEPERARRYAQAYIGVAPKDESGDMRLMLGVIAPEQSTPREIEALLDTLPALALSQVWATLARWPDTGEMAVRTGRALAAGRRGTFAFGGDSVQGLFLLASQLAYRGHLREAVRNLPGQPMRSGGARLHAELALAGALPSDSAAAMFSRWLRGADQALTVWALPWWAFRRDTASLREVARRAAVIQRSSTDPLEVQRARYRAASVRAYQALAQRDTAEAIARLAALPDSLCVGCVAERLVRAQLLVATGRNREASALLAERLGPVWIGFSSALWQLERARAAEQSGDREAAVRGYTFIANVWRRADPELQPYVTESRQALSRLSSEPQP